jgi:hypothetical protein
MFKQTTKIVLLFTLIQSLIFNPIVYADEQSSLPSPDVTAPTVVQTPITQGVKSGGNQEITATVTDDKGVKAVTLFYRSVGDKEYRRKAMMRIIGTDKYNAVIDNMPEQGLEYYIQAVDFAGNSLLHGYSFSPLVIHAEQDMPEAPPSTTQPMEASTAKTVEKKTSSSNRTWLWIGLGALVVGALASGGNGGGASGGSADGSGGGDIPPPSGKPTTGTVTVDAPLP